MFARVVTIQGKPDKVDDAIRFMKEQVNPNLGKMAGSKGTYTLVDRKSGKTVVVALWDTEKNLTDSLPVTAPFRANAAKILGAPNPPTVEHFEVALQP
jgi:hypothetical protein